MLAPLIGSAFNIWYNSVHILPLLTEGQRETLLGAITVYNGLAYPLAVALWLSLVMSMRSSYRGILAGSEVDPVRLARARVTAINLPWYAAAIITCAWVGSIGYFLLALSGSADPVDTDVRVHLPVSILISMMVSMTYGVFAVELLAQHLLYPVLFHDTRPAQTKGALKITLVGRGLLWALTASVCPVASLLLLMLVGEPSADNTGFAIAVAVLGVGFALGSAILLAKLVLGPFESLRRGAVAVAAGDLTARVADLRADEMGPLIDQFNDMVGEIRIKEHIARTFGLHVGREAAEQILARDPGLGGLELDISVMFCDIRNFTSHSAANDAHSVVTMLNEFLTVMVEVVERHGGMVNKFLGDGFMALFGAGHNSSGHAPSAVRAGEEMLVRLEELRAAGKIHADMGIGIGIHSGRAVVGSIGSPMRLEHTAIGATVNLASRVEGLTKVIGKPLAFTRATREQLPHDRAAEHLGAHPVKGVSEHVEVFTVPPPGPPPPDPA